MADFTKLRALVDALEQRELSFEAARSKAASDASLAAAAAATATASKGLEDQALADERAASDALKAEIDALIAGN